MSSFFAAASGFTSLALPRADARVAGAGAGAADPRLVPVALTAGAEGAAAVGAADGLRDSGCDVGTRDACEHEHKGAQGRAQRRRDAQNLHILAS